VDDDDNDEEYATDPATATCVNPTPPLDEVVYSPVATPKGLGNTSNNDRDALTEKISFSSPV
jgi:hypothetical protein